MKNLNINGIVQAKEEYTIQLNNVLLEPIKRYFLNTFEYVSNKQNEDGKPISVLVELQKNMKEIPQWNQFKINTEMENITNGCAYFSDLLAAVFVSNVKILTSVKLSKNSKKLQIKMPSNDVFIHSVYIKCAEEIYNNPYIFKKPKQVLKDELEKIIIGAIDSTIRTKLPLQNILQNYIGNVDDSESESESEKGSDDENEESAPASGGPFDEVPSDNEDAMLNDDEDDQVNENVNDAEPSETCEPPQDPESESAPNQQPVQQPVQQPTSNGFFDQPEDVKQINLQPKAENPVQSPFGELDS